MDVAGWAALTALVVAAIGAIGTVVLQVVQMILSYKRDTILKDKVDVGVAKVDDNTVKTVEGTRSATVNAQAAAKTAEDVKVALNGSLADRVKIAVTDAMSGINAKIVETGERISRHAENNRLHNEIIHTELKRIVQLIEKKA